MTDTVSKDYPVKVSIKYPERSSRLLALCTLLVFIKPLLLIPHFIIMYFLGVASLLALVCGQFAVLFTGAYPRPLFMFNKAVMQWNNRINSYFTYIRYDYFYRTNRFC